jgi:ectoine hydroxylase-related dioxygenase (phytanoyl-CoA dioxygenase family)
MTLTADPPRTAPDTRAAFALSPDEAARFHAQGYLGPYALCTPDEMDGLRRRIEAEVLPTDGPNPRNRLQCRHLDRRVVHDIVTHPAILDRMASLLGDDLVLWATYFFNKEPGGAEIPWHQDFNYWPIEPVVNLSAWIAIDPVTTENSCVRILPGSHKKIVPHVPSRDGMAFGEEADPAHVDDSRAVDMELAPGEFFLFNERLLHQSNRNRSDRRRLGLTARVTVPFVRVEHDRSPLFPGHCNVVVGGEDRMGFNRLAQPPAA